MIFWRVFSIISIIISVGCIIFMIIQGFLKNKYFHEYTNDELLKETRSVNSKNKIFFTNGETRKYIKRYVLCKTAYDKYLIVNFNQKFKYISYYVISYTNSKRIINVLQVSESNTLNTSKIISLTNSTKHVNVVIKNVDGLEINTNVIKPLSIRRIQLYSLFSSISFFTFLFSIRQLIIEIFLGPFKYTFLTGIYNYLIILGILLLSLLNYRVQSRSLRKKNAKYTSGGSLEYEFF